MKGDLSGLRSFGFTLPGPAYLVGLLLFSLIGLAAFRYGHRTGRQTTKWLGIGLMVYPYAVTQPWQLYAVGALLCAGVWFDRD